jgi:hypothetical protein
MLQFGILLLEILQVRSQRMRGSALREIDQLAAVIGDVLLS